MPQKARFFVAFFHKNHAWFFLLDFFSLTNHKFEVRGFFTNNIISSTLTDNISSTVTNVPCSAIIIELNIVAKFNNRVEINGIDFEKEKKFLNCSPL